MRPLAVALCVLGCQGGDPCSGHDGTCVALEVFGNGVSSLDQLKFAVTIPQQSTPLTASSPPTAAHAVSLPTWTALYFASGASGQAQIAVEGELNGGAVAGGSTSVTLGGHTQATVTLDALRSDAAIADLTPLADLSRTANDLAADLADLAALADLASADLVTLPAPCPAGSIFCDDFEGEDSSFARWNGGDSAGTMETFALDDSHPFLHGSQSLEVSSSGGSFWLHKLLPAPSGSMAVRFYFYAAGTPGVGATYLNLTDGVTSFSLGVTGGGSLDWQVSTGSAADSGGMIAVDSWRCVELDLDLTMGMFALYDTSASAPDDSAAAVLSGGFTPALFNVMNLGLFDAPSSGSADVWFDDVVVGTGRIGCE